MSNNKDLLPLIEENVYTDEELNQYTDEELIKLIHETGMNTYWEMLWLKTQRVVFYVYHDKVHDYYKNNMQEDVLGILAQGWVHAVNTYDENKATDVFFKYAIVIIRQHYYKFSKKITEFKEGKSVRALLLEGVSSDTLANEDTEFIQRNILEDKESMIMQEEFENKDFLADKLEGLKEALPESYKYIIENIYNNKSQRSLSKEYNVSTSYIVRTMQKGYDWIRREYKLDEIERNRLSKAYNRR